MVSIRRQSSRRSLPGKTGLKVGGYFLTSEACQDFEAHFWAHKGKKGTGGDFKSNSSERFVQSASSRFPAQRIVTRWRKKTKDSQPHLHHPPTSGGLLSHFDREEASLASLHVRVRRRRSPPCSVPRRTRAERGKGAGDGEGDGGSRMNRRNFRRRASQTFPIASDQLPAMRVRALRLGVLRSDCHHTQWRRVRPWQRGSWCEPTRATES